MAVQRLPGADLLSRDTQFAIRVAQWVAVRVGLLLCRLSRLNALMVLGRPGRQAASDDPSILAFIDKFYRCEGSVAGLCTGGMIMAAARLFGRIGAFRVQLEFLIAWRLSATASHATVLKAGSMVAIALLGARGSPDLQVASRQAHEPSYY